jgi:hypothetical protein
VTRPQLNRLGRTLPARRTPGSREARKKGKFSFSEEKKQETLRNRAESFPTLKLAAVVGRRISTKAKTGGRKRFVFEKRTKNLCKSEIARSGKAEAERTRRFLLLFSRKKSFLRMPGRLHKDVTSAATVGSRQVVGAVIHLLQSSYHLRATTIQG